MLMQVTDVFTIMFVARKPNSLYDTLVLLGRQRDTRKAFLP